MACHTSDTETGIAAPVALTPSYVEDAAIAAGPVGIGHPGVAVDEGHGGVGLSNLLTAKPLGQRLDELHSERKCAKEKMTMPNSSLGGCRQCQGIVKRDLQREGYR